MPFIVFEGDRLPILSYQTSLHINLVRIGADNFDIAALTTDLYPDEFDDKLGELPDTQVLRLKPDSQSTIMANRRIPLVLTKLKDELDRLSSLGVITPVNEPTPWVSQIVLAHKKNGKIRVCLDPHELNKRILREHFTLPVLEDVLHKLHDAKIYLPVTGMSSLMRNLATSQHFKPAMEGTGTYDYHLV